MIILQYHIRVELLLNTQQQTSVEVTLSISINTKPLSPSLSLPLLNDSMICLLEEYSTNFSTRVFISQPDWKCEYRYCKFSEENSERSRNNIAESNWVGSSTLLSWLLDKKGRRLLWFHDFKGFCDQSLTEGSKFGIVVSTWTLLLIAWSTSSSRSCNINRRWAWLNN